MLLPSHPGQNLFPDSNSPFSSVTSPTPPFSQTEFPVPSQPGTLPAVLPPPGERRLSAKPTLPPASPVDSPHPSVRASPRAQDPSPHTLWGQALLGQHLPLRFYCFYSTGMSAAGSPPASCLPAVTPAVWPSGRCPVCPPQQLSWHHRFLQNFQWLPWALLTNIIWALSTPTAWDLPSPPSHPGLRAECWALGMWPEWWRTCIWHSFIRIHLF